MCPPSVSKAPWHRSRLPPTIISAMANRRRCHHTKSHFAHQVQIKFNICTISHGDRTLSKFLALNLHRYGFLRCLVLFHGGFCVWLKEFVHVNGCCRWELQYTNLYETVKIAITRSRFNLPIVCLLACFLPFARESVWACAQHTMHRTVSATD